jgi:hypothetical protein
MADKKITLIPPQNVPGVDPLQTAVLDADSPEVEVLKAKGWVEGAIE